MSDWMALLGPDGRVVGRIYANSVGYMAADSTVIYRDDEGERLLEIADDIAPGTQLRDVPEDVEPADD